MKVVGCCGLFELELEKVSANLSLWRSRLCGNETGYIFLDN